MITFWPSRAPEKGVCGGAKIFGSAYYSQRAVFASPLRAFSLCSISGLAAAVIARQLSERFLNIGTPLDGATTLNIMLLISY